MSDLARADGACRAFSGWLSLSPERERARLPSDLSHGAPALSDALVLICDSVLTHFPNNLFCDLDALTRSLSRRSQSGQQRAAERIANLQALYGGATTIRFRYVHDFIYGFDWARWVARAPEERAHVGPYDDAFLDYLETRANELFSLIAKNDPKYPPLQGRQDRSPFPFSREPEAEAQLLRSLACKGWLPVAAWSADIPPVWNRPFATMREEEARALGTFIPR